MVALHDLANALNGKVANHHAVMLLTGAESRAKSVS